MKNPLTKPVRLDDCSLLEAAFICSGGSYRKTRRVVSFIVSWNTYAELTDSREAPTQQGYADYWGVSERSVQRDVALLREVFPNSTGPNDPHFRHSVEEINDFTTIGLAA